MPEERWRRIPNLDVEYEISTEARIRRLTNKGPKEVRSFWVKTAKSVQIALGRKGSRKRYNVRDIMRDVWMDGKIPGYYVSVRDGDFCNLRLSNLVYRTRVDLSKKYGTNRRPIKATFSSGEIRFYPSMAEAARQNHLTTSGVLRRIKRKGRLDGVYFEYDD